MRHPAKFSKELLPVFEKHLKGRPRKGVCSKKGVVCDRPEKPHLTPDNHSVIAFNIETRRTNVKRNERLQILQGHSALSGQASKAAPEHALIDRLRSSQVG